MLLAEVYEKQERRDGVWKRLGFSSDKWGLHPITFTDVRSGPPGASRSTLDASSSAFSDVSGIDYADTASGGPPLVALAQSCAWQWVPIGTLETTDSLAFPEELKTEGILTSRGALRLVRSELRPSVLDAETGWMTGLSEEDGVEGFQYAHDWASEQWTKERVIAMMASRSSNVRRRRWCKLAFPTRETRAFIDIFCMGGPCRPTPLTQDGVTNPSEDKAAGLEPGRLLLLPLPSLRLHLVNHLIIITHGVGYTNLPSKLEKMQATLLRLQHLGYDIGRAGVDITYAAWFESCSSGTLGNITAWLGSLHVHQNTMIRETTERTFLQAALYMGPFRGEMEAALQNELNRSFAAFVATHPNYINGDTIMRDAVARYRGEPTPSLSLPRHVSLFGHSLGGVISLDTLLARPYPLLFQPSHCFTLGSPTGMYFSLRALPKHELETVLGRIWDGPTPPDTDEGAPGVAGKARPGTKLHNIFDTRDPIAYLTAPLFWDTKGSGETPPTLHLSPAADDTSLRKYRVLCATADAALIIPPPPPPRAASLLSSSSPSSLGIGPSGFDSPSPTAEAGTSIQHPVLKAIYASGIDIALPKTPLSVSGGSSVIGALHSVGEYMEAYHAHMRYWESPECLLYVVSEILLSESQRHLE
jgi:hypothetical protein